MGRYLIKGIYTMKKHIPKKFPRVFPTLTTTANLPTKGILLFLNTSEHTGNGVTGSSPFSLSTSYRKVAADDEIEPSSQWVGLLIPNLIYGL